MASSRSPRFSLRRGTAAIVLILVAASGCGSSDASSEKSEAGSARLHIVTTVAPITSIVSAIAGPLARIDGVVPEGANSHTFEPPPSTAEILATADLVFMNGLQLEEPTRLLAERIRKGDDGIVFLGDETLPRDQWIFDFSFPESEGKPNPHLWTDPGHVLRYAEVILDRLTEADPANAASYSSNHAVFATSVGQLDKSVRIATASVPASHRRLLTYHDAYAYFGRSYGWEIVGAIQVSSFDDPSPKEVAALIDQVRSLQLPAIFGSEVFPSPVLAQIGREAGVRYVDSLRDDDLPGRPGDKDHSWLGLMVYNYRTMVSALGGDPQAFDAVDTASSVVDKARYPQ